MLQKSIKNRGWWVTIIVAFLLFVLVVGTVNAAEFPPDGTIPVGKVIDDDVFLSSEEVLMDGTVNGMLISTGQTITINGTVHGDALLMGETVVLANGALIDGNLFTTAAIIQVDGRVSGSVFSASASAELKENARVGRNLYYGGFSLTTKEGSMVNTDLFSGVYQAILNGAVARDVKIGAGAIDLYGTVGRNAVFNVGHDKESRDPETWFMFTPGRNYFPPAIPAGIHIADSARIAGNLTFTSDSDQSAEFKQVTSGSVTYQAPAPLESYRAPQSRAANARRSVQGFSLFQGLQRFLTLFLLGALVIWLLLKPFNRVVEAGYRNPLQAAGWGFVVMAVGFLAMLMVPLVFVLMAVFLGFISLGGLLFAWLGVVGAAIFFITMAFLLVVFTLSKVVALYLVGKWLTGHLFPTSAGNAWVILVVGVFVYVLVAAIPVVGVLAGIAAALLGTGAIWLSLPSFGKRTRKTVAK